MLEGFIIGFPIGFIVGAMAVGAIAVAIARYLEYRIWRDSL